SPGIDADVQAKAFHGALYLRLAAWRIELPPLRGRSEDIPGLAVRLLEMLCAERRLAARRFTQPALALLAALSWPGNLTELRAVVGRVVAAAPDDLIQMEDVLPALHLDGVAATFVPRGTLA